jgi:serine/threonine-protein kinase
MAADRWDKLKAIFSEASELPEADRPAFLDQACEGDEDLRAEVEKLLAQLSDETETVPLLDPVPRHTLENGQLLAGRFEVRRYVGQGGMGEVYEAEDKELGGSVAIKIIRPDLLDDSEFVNRFRREVQLARQVTHPNVCRVFDVGLDKSAAAKRLFLTMEFLDGETLNHYLRRVGVMRPEAAYPLVRQMAEGLAALHAQEIIHRDFKPGNVMVVRQTGGGERAVISDFGLARAVVPGGDASRPSSQFWGTPDYMSPEQLLGRRLTPASDIYALGLVMYEMVTGKKAFPGGKAIENAVQRLVEKPTPPCEESAGIPAAWNSVILRCLDQDPAVRPAAAEIAAALAGSGLQPPPSAPVPAPRWGLARAAIFLVPVLALLLAGLRYTGWPGTGTGGGTVTEQQVALLPLRVPGGDPKLQAFAQGLMESINGRLSQFEVGTTPLVVVPASEVRSQDARTARDALAKFRATAAVEGALESEGNQVRLLLTVIDTRGMRQLETIQLQDDRANSFRLQDTAVTRLAQVLNARLMARHAKDQQQLSAIEPGAYDYYLQARGYLQRNDQPQSLESAVTLLQRALELDPKFALAHSALGEAYFYQYQLNRDSKLIDLANASGNKGLELNPNLAGTHVSMGRIEQGTGRDAEALREFEKAVELDPRDNEAVQGLANAYAALKQYDRAEATYREAIAMRSGDWTGYKQLGLYYYRRGDLDKAIEQYKKVVDLTPDSAHGHSNLAAFYFLKDDVDQAKQHLQRALEIDPKRVGTLVNLGKLYYLDGQYGRAVELYERALAANARTPRVWGQAGLAYRGLGNLAKSGECFAQSIKLLDEELRVNPRNPDALGLAAFYRAVTGEKPAVVAPLIERFLESGMQNKENLILAGETFAVLGDSARALELARKAMALGYSEKSLRRSVELRPLLSTILSKP